MGLLLIIGAPITIGLLLIGFSKALNRTAIGSTLSLPSTLVASHSLLLLALMALYPLGIFEPQIPFEDVYFPYYFAPGLHIYWPGVRLTYLADPLLHNLPQHIAYVLAVIILPGIAGLFFGGIQWFLIGKLLTRNNPA